MEDAKQWLMNRKDTQMPFTQNLTVAMKIWMHAHLNLNRQIRLFSPPSKNHRCEEVSPKAKHAPENLSSKQLKDDQKTICDKEEGGTPV